ncbi:PhzF family phenazine biosynthesis protein [Sphingomonas profundi]|uniref:PhzF family phenazine biosynthesis protein n=1 Tax=Alterirhizorhabdus profundi TaxID=2681549 RepID=UPI0012E86DAC|nr:PhzF family phenazine biosynthesis protein [Sphingomonas profundi]
MYEFETVDVFTDRRFGGNPLAVFPDARGLSAAEMQALAAELNLSETTFVLPPEDEANTARVRIFNRTAEMPFAGHPSIGTGYVLAKRGRARDGILTLEVPAGLVRVEIETDEDGRAVGGLISAPQPLTTGETIPAATIAACLGLAVEDVVVSAHQPVVASVGNLFVLAQVTEEALSRCLPNVSEFRAAQDAHPSMAGRFSLHVYAGDGSRLRARMFAPLAGTWEDPATGSANAPLGALLLSLGSADFAEFEVRQGVEMGRPSLLIVTARRRADGIRATVAGRCVPVLAGHAQVRDTER